MKAQDAYRNEQLRIFELENLLLLSEELMNSRNAKEMNKVLNEMRRQITAINKITQKIIRE